MGYLSNPTSSPGGPERDDADHAKLRHGRVVHEGRTSGRFLMPAPLLFSRDGHNVFLGDMYRGGHAFLICSGPSLATHDLTLLQQRGIVSCAVNNAATIVRSSLWVSVDDPGNFADAIWRDPGIVKLVPLCHMEKPFTVRNDVGQLVESQERVGDMPAVFGFRRNEAFNAEQFLYEDTVNWGNHGERTDAHGFKGSRSVMLAAVRLLFHLGIRSLYLLGCDFKMSHGTENYAFPQNRSRSSVNGNNKTFECLNSRFRHLLPHFEREGFQVFNCTPNSGLRAFPQMNYEEAIARSLAGFPVSINTSGMYDRKQRTHDATKLARKSKVDSSNAIASPNELSLLTTVDETTSEILANTWETWMRFHPWMTKLPAFVLVAPGFDLREVMAKLWKFHPRAKAIDLARQKLLDPNWFHFAAERVRTPWFLRLDPSAIATSAAPWFRREWLSPGQVASPAFVAPKWGYSKPATVLNDLDDWADRARDLEKFPRLNIPVSSTDDRVLHDAISTWLFLGNTRWAKEFNRLTESSPAIPLETKLAYVATRRQERFIRWAFKDHGWEHSFKGLEKVPARCKAVLGGAA